MGTMPPKTSQHAEADAFTAIAHPARRQLLNLLLRGEQSVTQLSASFSISRPAISQHLQILLAARLVAEERHGRERRYHLAPQPLRAVAQWIEPYEHFWRDRLEVLGTYLEEQHER
jgi:DNA-binding transcriptional ArsR family regulator